MKNTVIALATVGVLSLIGLATLTQPQPTQAAVQYCDANSAKHSLKAKDGNGNYTLGVEHALRTWNMNKVEVKNTNTNCTYKLGLASYKAYEHYTVSVKSQTYHASTTIDLGPGQVWTKTISIPDCTYQVDFFQGYVLGNFKTTTYSDQGRLLDAWYFPGDASQQGKLPVCKHKPTPTPTKPTPTPTKPTPTPTKPTPTPTKVKPVCPEGTIWNDKNNNNKVDNGECEKPSTPVCPDGSVWNDKNGNSKVDQGECEVPVPTPTTAGVSTTPTLPAELPSTGPGVAAALSLMGIVGGLMFKKFGL